MVLRDIVSNLVGDDKYVAGTWFRGEFMILLHGDDARVNARSQQIPLRVHSYRKEYEQRMVLSVVGLHDTPFVLGEQFPHKGRSVSNCPRT